MVRHVLSRRWFLRIVTTGLCVVMVTGLSRLAAADEASAKKLVEATRKLLTEAESDAPVPRLGKLDQVRKNLKLVGVELADVEGPAKESIEKEVQVLQAQAARLASSGEVQDAVNNVNSLLAAAKESLGNPDTLEQHLKQVETTLKNADVRKALGEAKVSSITKQIAALRKASIDQRRDAAIDQLKESIGRLENGLPDALKEIESDSPAARDAAIRSFQGRDYQLVEKILEWLPADDSEARPMIARFKKIDGTFSAAVAKVSGGEAADRLKRDWELYLNEFEGWEKETAAPTFEQITKQQSQAMSSLGAPKTVALASRATNWLKTSVEDNAGLKPLLSDARVKAIVGQVRSQRDAAHQKLTGFAESILKEAAAAKLDPSSRDRLETFVKDDLRLALEGTTQLADLQSRGQALIEQFDKAAGGSAADKEKRYEELVQKARSDWPAMLKKYSPEKGFDPAQAGTWKGKVVHLAAVSNRLGWDYKTDDYDFAMAINGHPVAGRFAPAIRDEVKKVLSETGKNALPEEEYNVVAVVGGPCKLQRRVQREGTVEVQGVKANVEAEGWEPVDAVLLNIAAVHCGPVAIAVEPDAASFTGGSGMVGKPGGSKWLSLVLGMFAGSLALIKANFAPLVNLPQVRRFREKVGDDVLGRIGIILATIGLYALLRGWFFYGLLVSGTLVAAGVFAGSDILVALGILKPAVVEKLKPFGVLIGLACVAAALVQLITAGTLRII